MGLFYILSLSLALLPNLPAILAAPLVLALVFVPGSFALTAISPRQLNIWVIITTAGLSLLFIMMTGAVLNLVLLPIGIERPLSTIPIVIGISTVLGSLAVPHLRNPDRVVLTIPSQSPDFHTYAVLSLLPLWSILSVSLLNRTGKVVPVISVLVLVGLVPVFATIKSDQDWHAFGVWSIALAILYHDSLWIYSGFGGSPGVVSTWELGRWTPGIGSVGPASTTLLENGTLFPAFARLTGVDILTQMEVINPFIVSLIPVGMYVAFSEFVESDTALLASSIFVFAHPFYLQYPTAGRAAMPVLFLVMLSIVVANKNIDTFESRLLNLIFATGIVTTHYGTAYYVLAAVLIATVLRVVYDILDELLAEGEKLLTTDRISRNTPSLDELSETRRRNAVFSLTFSLFYGVAVIWWYMYTVGGAKFKLFPNHSIRILRQFTEGTLFVGGTTERIQRSYGGEAVSISKNIYILLAVLTLLGLLVAHYRNIWQPSDFSINRTFLSFSTGLFGLFGLTVIFQTWGGGRPMMVAFSFTSLFAVVGFFWVSGLVSKMLGYIGVSKRFSKTRPAKFIFATLLVVFLLLNTGVASAILLDGRAPSNVPLHSQVENSPNPSVRSDAFRTVDTHTHVWINDNHPRTNSDWGKVHADAIGSGQTDWYRPRIELQSVGHNAYYEWWKPRFDLYELAGDRSPSGYILLMGHNTALNTISVGNSEEISLDQIRPGLSNMSRIYSTGDTSIYFGNETSISGR